MKTTKHELWEIRPLRWIQKNSRTEEIHSCDTVAGLIRIKLYAGMWEVWVNYAGQLGRKRFLTPRSAKAAAEKWYRTQLKKALRRATS